MQAILNAIVNTIGAVLNTHVDKTNELGLPRPQINDLCSTTQTCRPQFLLEKHMTVIRKGPTTPLTLEMYQFEDQLADVNDVTEGTAVTAIFRGLYMDQSANFVEDPDTQIANFGATGKGRAVDGENISMFYTKGKVQKTSGDKLVIPIDILESGEDWSDGDQLIITHEYVDIFGNQKIATCRCEIITASQTRWIDDGSGGEDWVTPEWSPYVVHGGTWPNGTAMNPAQENTWGAYKLPGEGVNNFVHATVISMSGTFPITATSSADIYRANLVQIEPLFRVKFPKFSYRYKYEDGEYSVFAPWSETAFIPGEFDYSPKKGYNLGMENNLRLLKVLNWRPNNCPNDVVQIDILYKESNSPNIYTVESFKKDDPIESALPYNYWDTPGNGNHFGNYTIKTELIHKVVASNQLLRPWDNVPRKALGQEVTANRLIFANYLQQYNIERIDPSSNDRISIKPSFAVGVEESNPWEDEVSNLGYPAKSLKSQRTYQVGVVYRDKYGRETPILTSKSGSVDVKKSSAQYANRLNVELKNDPPYWAESYTFYIKETSNEYYNIAMDRWYDAEDGGVWLSFPSSERNKINEDTNLILKKKHDSNEFTEYDVSYKVLSISSNAPKFVKTDSKYWGSIPIMLPPPGWGDVGNWDTGMLHPTGLPLPNRMNIDVIAEYFDSTALKGLNNFKGAQIRISQSPGVPSSYNSVTNELTNVTKWYNVANINYIGSPGQTYFDENGVEQEVEGLPVRIARIALETAFGSDALFCESDSVLQPTGSDGGSYISANSNISMSRGLSIEARTTEEKDKAQFEGRFFVKILRDANVEANIVQSQATQSEDWQVLQSKDIKYVCAAHPGTQDWNHSYYIAPHVDWTTNTPGTESLLVSSLSKYVKMTSATYVDAAGALQDGPNLGGKRWPFGPSNHTDGTYSTPGYWQTKNKDFLDGNNDFKDSQNTVSEWPSYGPHSLSWEPAHHWAIAGDYGNATNSTGTYSFLTNASTLTQRGILDLSGGCSTGGGANGQITGLCADNPIQLSWLNTSVTSAITPGTDPRGYRGVANPYMVPAVWGDQSDFIVSAATCDPGALWPRGCQPVFSTGTMEKLSQHWYNLWRGRNIAGSEWPLGSFHPDRWFFDKAGAAEGGSGNGIWNDGMQSYMHVSYWGLGKAGGYNRESNTALAAKHQPTELMFAEAMGTVGTTFRFKQDPDQTVYTVTNVQVEGAVWNYENPVGSWGYKDQDTGAATGGGGVFGKMLPPFGSATKGSGLAGGTAFMSDVVMAKHTPNSERARLTGGAPSNRRVRYTLTLDKVIGAEGPNSFHPITNHVDAEGKANVKRGRQKYFTSLNHGITSDFGATPGSEEYYNLNSYWNANDNAGGGKNKQPSYTDKGYNTKFAEEITAGSKTAQNYYGDDGGTSPPNPGGYIGLHERGINETTIEVISRYSGKDREFPMSNNPAIWETEPKEDVGLDIYYAASPTFPVQLKRNRWSAESVGSDGNSQADEVDGFGANWYDFSGRGEDIIKVGSWVRVAGYQEMKVCDVKDDLIFLDRIVQLDDGTAQDLPLGTPIRIEWYGEGAYYGAARDTEWVDMIIHEYMGEQVYRIGESGALQSGSHKVKHGLGYYNCYSFGTGVESNRVRDDYNAVTLGKGIKASMPLAEQYKEERKGSGLIFSGIYNSTSGINRTNQFIQAEPITKDLNPVNGSIQKLFARDTDLVTFCENKIFKILAKKDALFNADGNTNVTSNSAVLGQAIPFSGEYGISRNPESFASESYRVYFTDKDRGAVLRLSKDGLTPISDQGMKDWFRDNLRFATSLIGSHDDREDQYNLTLETADQDGVEKAYTISYTEKARGWVSFKSFIQQGGISHKNIYYTFPSNKYNDIRILDPWGIVYKGKNGAEAHQHNLDIRLERVTTTTLSGGLNMQVNDGIGVILEGMNVSGNGIPIDTRVGGVVCASGFCNVTLTTADSDGNDSLWVSNSTAIKFTTARNRFYGKDNYSMVKVLFNGAQGSVKRFKTLNYEGTQTRVVGEERNKITYYENINYGGTEKDLIGRKSDDYYDNYTKKGWWVHNISTDMQEGAIKEFVDKENKWFSYIRGTAGTLVGGDFLDTAEFSIQGLGFSGSKLPTIYGCMDEAASEYNEEATVDDGSCYTDKGGGCTDPTAYNYNINATHADGIQKHLIMLLQLEIHKWI